MLGQRGGSRTDTLIKLVLIFFISLLSFSVGTFVGKQFSDSQHKLASLENEFEGGSRETASVPSNVTEVKPDDALTDKDVQQIAEEFNKPEEKKAAEEHGDHAAAAEAKPAGEHEAAAEPATADHRDVASTKAEPKKEEHAEAAKAGAAASAAERIAHDKTPVVQKPEVVNKLPKELPTEVAATTVGKFTVQISSHQSADEAKEEATKLKSKGFSAFVVPANVKGKNWYRVSVGLFEKKDEAKTYREKLMKDAGISSAIVQQIVQ